MQTIFNKVLIDYFFFSFVTGLPDCGSSTTRSVYHYKNSTDKLRLIDDGTLRHCIYHNKPEECDPEYDDGKEQMYYDYTPGKYCLDKVNSSSLVI